MTAPLPPSPFKPNDLVPCPSRSARLRHVATATYCAVCGTPGRTVALEPLASILQRYRDAQTGDAA